MFLGGHAEGCRPGRNSPLQIGLRFEARGLTADLRDCDTYFHPERAGRGHASTPFHTAWAILGLMAAGEVDSHEVRRGAEYLMRSQQGDGLWKDERFNAPGFPRVFYLGFHR